VSPEVGTPAPPHVEARPQSPDWELVKGAAIADVASSSAAHTAAPRTELHRIMRSPETLLLDRGDCTGMGRTLNVRPRARSRRDPCHIRRRGSSPQ
jgi:hypothetical protein